MVSLTVADPERSDEPAASASSLVMRPPRPLPATLAAATPFSSRILRAAGSSAPSGRRAGTVRPSGPTQKHEP